MLRRKTKNIAIICVALLFCWSVLSSVSNLVFAQESGPPSPPSFPTMPVTATPSGPSAPPVATPDLPLAPAAPKEILPEEKALIEAEIPKEPEAKPKGEAPPEKVSPIEAMLSGQVPSTVSTRLKQFGYDLFRTTVSTFAPVADVPVGPDYVIGPGDRFNIFMWGRMNTTYPVQVNRNGEIAIPKVGMLSVTGLTLAQLEKFLFHTLSRYYKDFQMSVTMDRVRTITVFVVGQAVNPGSYSLSSLSTVYNALFAAGGPSKQGSMRRIKLIRNHETLRTIDLYDFLLKGDKSQDERLQSGDTIFIPDIGPVVGVAGNVKRPAIYEMNGQMTLGEAIDLAGGVTPVGYLQRVQLERIVAHEKRIVEDFDLSGFAKEKDSSKLNIPLKDGDVIKIFPIFPDTQQIVYLEGHVKRPGGYQFRPGMKLANLISSYDELLPEPYLDYGEIVRLIPPDFHPETISFNVKRLLDGDPSENLPLQEHDRVILYSEKDMKEIPQVTISGEVQRPGKYRLLAGMRIKDLLYKAGNLKRSAYLPKAEITRCTKTEEGVKIELGYVDLREVLKENPQQNMVLKPDDHLVVRRIPDWAVDETITISGEVKFPGIYTISEKTRLSSVLERAGGFTEYAYLKGAFYTRESVKELQRKRLQELIQKMEQDILEESAKASESGLSDKDATSVQASIEAKKALVERLKRTQVTGRLIVKLDTLDKFKNSPYDIEVRDGDTLHIPRMPGEVNVLGEVYNPTSIIYTKGKPLKYYLSKVGGPTPDADKDQIFVIKADGTVMNKRQQRRIFPGVWWDKESHRWNIGGFMSARLDPGDTILVPRKMEKIRWKRELMDWTTMLYQITIGAGVAIATF